MERRRRSGRVPTSIPGSTVGTRPALPRSAPHLQRKPAVRQTTPMPDSPATKPPVASAPCAPYDPAMPDDLYDRDVLAWSEHQADLLRRLARGERVNDLDWEHVVEEIEDVGLSELHAVVNYLEQILVHLLKVQAWPDSDSLNHWRAEIISFQGSAERRFAPLMERRIDLATLYQRAVRQVTTLNRRQRPPDWPESCPFSLDGLLRQDWAELEQTFQAASPTTGC